MLQKFFEKFGLPKEWITPDGDLLVNLDDTGAIPDVNDGDEVFISIDDIIIDGNEISIRAVCTPGNFKERFSAQCKANSAKINAAQVKTILNDKVEFEGGSWTHEL